MANVVRFTLPAARTLSVPGAGIFKSGVLDVDANDLHLLKRTRYLVKPYGAIEVGTVAAGTAYPSLPAVPSAPNPDPYPQYLTEADVPTSPALRAAFVPKWKPNTAYAAGEPVLNPSGQTVTANTSFTSGASYNAANWTVVSGGGGTVSDATTSTKGIVQLAGDLAGTAAAPTVAKIGGVTPAAVATSGAYADLSGKPTPSSLGAAPLLVPTATKTAPYTAAVGDLAMMNVAGGGITLNLPTAPADKSQVGYRAIGATTTVPLTINRGGSTDTIGTAGTTSVTIPLADEVAVLQYDAANTRWLAVANVKTMVSQDFRYNPRKTARGIGVAAVGDSNSVNGSNVTTLKAFGPGLIDQRTILAQAVQQSGGKAIYRGSWGLGSTKIADTLNTQIPDLLATCVPLPAACVIMSGTNDVIVSGGMTTTWAQFKADYIAAAALLVTNGIIPVLCTILPRGDLAGNPLGVNQVNQFIRKLAAAKGYPIADLFAAVGSTVAGAWAAGQNFDSLHVSALGAKNAGITIGAVLSKILDGVDAGQDLIQTQGTITGSTAGLLNNNDTTYSFGNGLLVDSNADNVPDLWSAVNGTGTGTTAADATLATKGNVIKLVRNAANTNWRAINFPVVVGHRYRLAVRLRIKTAEGVATALGGTLIRGSGAPSAGTGTDGQFYIDTTNLLWYGPKAAGAWPASSALPSGTFQCVTSDSKTVLVGWQIQGVDIDAGTFAAEFVMPATNSYGPTNDGSAVTGLARMELVTNNVQGTSVEAGQITLIDLTAQAIDTVV